ncbi:MAG: acyl-CoA dehydrogenase family protein [Coriobacteriaceae bacterium]|nr:acyl-CoA dehydrogenase family protein [Coriobacteriaceae bacterium]
MNIDLTDQQLDMIQSMREYGESTFVLENVRQWREDQGLPDDVVQEFARRYFALPASTNGGSAFSQSLLNQALIIEELSRCAGCTLPFQNDLFELHIMAGFASDNDFSTVIDDFRRTGRVMFSLAVSEPQAGSDTQNMKTSVRTQDGRLVLNGVKTFVNNGEYAPNILVAAIDEDAPDDVRHPALSFWFIPRNLRGIKAYPINKIGQSMLPFATVAFEEVELKPEYRLTGPNATAGFPHLFSLLERGRIFTCASSLGMAQAAMEDAVRYANERIAFGTPIGEFQQIEQMLTDMEIRLWNMRNLLYSAAMKSDEDASDKRLAIALMKRYIPEAATQVASDAMQILGGIGYTERERVSHIWRDCRGNQLAEGTDQIMVYIAAPLIRKKYGA